MTIRDAVANAVTTLSGIYPIGEAEAISTWLIENVSGVKRIERATNATSLNAEQQARLKSLLERLLKHEPLQYVLNESYFLGFRFYVDGRVLIPRPETEELVEWIISDCKFPIDQLSILDIGTGSGCIPVSLKRRLGKAEISSIDISADALDVARKNASDLGVNVNFLQLNFLVANNWKQLKKYDIIVSNPPYIPEKDRAEMNKNVLAFEPAVALFVPDEDPLLFYRSISEFAKDHLHENGSIYMELHEAQSIPAVKLFQEHGFETQIKQDMQGKLRMLRARRKL